MSQPNDFPQSDEALLMNLEALLAQRKDDQRPLTELPDNIYTQLAHVIPSANDQFRQTLESRLLAALELQQTQTVDTFSLSGVWNQLLSLKGEMTMRKAFILIATFLFVLIVSTLALVPSVRAQVRALAVTIVGLETDFLYPGYLPEGFEQSLMTFGEFDTKENKVGQLEFKYHNGQQFIVIVESEASAGQVLPEGRSVTIQGYPGVLVEGLAGSVQVGVSITRDESGEGVGGVKLHRLNEDGTLVEEEESVTFEAYPIKSTPIIINYSNARQLTWYTDELKVELLSNLSEAELVKVAESLAPQAY